MSIRRQVCGAAALGVVVSLAFGGCGKVAAQGASGLASARCAREKSCAPTIFAEHWASDEACVETETRDVNTAIHAYGAHLDDAFLDACGASLAAQPCADFASGMRTTACAPPAGDLPLLAACSFDAQCQSSRCIAASSTSCGHCDAGDGDVGASSVHGCKDGLVVTAGVCTAPPAAGASCVVGSSYCPLGQRCVAGACVTSQPGAPCGLAADCDLAAGEYCAPETSTCTPSTLLPHGATCTNAYGELCAASATCQYAPNEAGTAGHSTCVPWPVLGEPCGYPNPYACADGLTCAGGHCVYAPLVCGAPPAPAGS